MANFDESKHPRDNDGKFTSGGGSSAEKRDDEKKPTEKKLTFKSPKKSTLTEEQQEIVNEGKEQWVETKEDEQVWNSLSDEDKYLVVMSNDIGFWTDELDGDDETKERIDELTAKFSRVQNMKKYKLNAWEKASLDEEFDEWEKKNPGYMEWVKSGDAERFINKQPTQGGRFI